MSSECSNSKLTTKSDINRVCQPLLAAFKSVSSVSCDQPSQSPVLAISPVGQFLSLREAGVGKRLNIARPKTSQIFSIELWSDQYAGHSIHAILSFSRKSSTMAVLSRRTLLSIKTKGVPTFAAYSFRIACRNQ